MKKLIYTFGFVILLASCNSINKLIDRGDYDGAFELAVRKLDRQRKKKTDHVIGLEKAFYQLNQEDLDRIKYLNDKPSPRNWDKVESIANNIIIRQALLEPILPLVSEEGYEANFNFVDTESIVFEARQNGAEYYYSRGKNLLDVALENNDKGKAKAAFNYYKDANKRVPNYKDAKEKMHEAHQLGIKHHIVNIDHSLEGYIPSRLFQNLDYIDVSEFDNFWNKYYSSTPDNVSIDRTVILDIRELIVKPERELVTYHTDKARVKDGYRYLKDKKGKILKDSLGNKLKEDKFKMVFADITEVYREKNLVLHSELRVTDIINNSTLKNRPLSVQIAFEDQSSTFVGDRRAICGKGHGDWKKYPAAFPSDELMISDAVAQLTYDFKYALHEI